jgi:hypothetical protein
MAVGGITINPLTKNFLNHSESKHALIASSPVLICLGLSSHFAMDMLQFALIGVAVEALGLGPRLCWFGTYLTVSRDT